ncbi:glycosyltransferase family 4 protein [Serratia ficaria]|uniref:Glycogen synthase n=1 Tax=Serratia ficaria TaxID=61651 RepID=A0A240BPZ3_SERFI|nr:glycosyltransferase family 4 protein [Serratia ficaria]MEE4483838.1 glycosyltransferase family 4 protein [Serratia ficaria]REF45554.1 rhamnosyl/mannosyltransferase [Serratia ficaria]CAI0874020.1 Glycogen synthase [Serratia ficaria]CAI0907638.1 Glycogen synthase [Serratia ficaria]CAI0959421.1 Glycogen synthase [Serratia ficaria]
MIKVLHFYKTYYPDSFGGIEQVIYQLAEGGVEKGVSTDVLSVTPADKDSCEVISQHTAHKVRQDFSIASNPFSLRVIKKFKELSEQADIIHYHFPWPYMDLVHFLSGVKKPTVVSYHSDIIRQKNLLRLYKPLMHLFLRKVDCIVATSPNYVATSDVLETFKDKVTVIPIGLDKATYPVPEQSRLDKWQRQIGQPFFLFIGTLRYYKGLHILLEAAIGADYPIVIVGAGPIESELREQAQNLGLKNVHFLGALPDEDKTALLMLCYGIVFPSHLRSEAFGISLLEGAMYRKPMISSEIGTGTTFINIDNQTGLVIPPSDPSALRKAMDKLWGNPRLAEQFGNKAYERYEEMFTSKQMVEEYTKIYRSLLARQNEPG